MRVILLENINKLGNKGDLKEVADGYARNFLLPHNLAQLATPNLIEQWRQKQIKLEAEREQKHKELEGLQKKINGLELKLIIKTGESGKAFKGIGSDDISKALAEKGFDVPKTKIEFTTVKEIGSYEALLSLGEGIKAKIKILIKAQKKTG